MAGSSSTNNKVSVPARVAHDEDRPSWQDSSAETRGKQIVKLLPLPGLVSTTTTPAPCLTLPKTVDKPSPALFPCSLVVKKGSKRWDRVYSSIPQPVSLT